MSAGFGFATLTYNAETILVRELALKALRLPPDLATVHGTYKDGYVSLYTRAYTSCTLRYARVSVLLGDGIEIGNVLCLPRAAYPLPILGADLVTLRPETGMVAVDLSPTMPPGLERDRQLAPLAARRAAQPIFPSAGELPEWCRRWFSPHALFTRGTPAALCGMDAALADFLDCYITAVRRTAARVEGEHARSYLQESYLEAHRVEDRGLRLLAHMFGSEWAQRYLEEAMFPGLPVAV